MMMMIVKNSNNNDNNNNINNNDDDDDNNNNNNNNNNNKNPCVKSVQVLSLFLYIIFPNSVQIHENTVQKKYWIQRYTFDAGEVSEISPFAKKNAKRKIL